MKALFFLILMASVGSARAENLCDTALLNSSLKSLNQGGGKPCANCEMSDAEEPRWELFWGDEFKTDGKPDPDKWKYEIGGHGFGNEEDQFYTDRLENARVENGRLVIEARREDFEGKKYTSSRMNSRQPFTYGRVEFRAKMPKGIGLWPAAWLLPEKQTYGTQYWPDNGELDVLEAIGHENNINHFSAHTKAYNFTQAEQRTAVTEVEKGDKEFHNYAMEWLPGHIDFFVDDKKILTVKREAKDTWKEWPFDQDFHLVMNLAVGGFWGRSGGTIEDATFPARLEFEYVRVYRPLKAKDCSVAEK